MLYAATQGDEGGIIICSKTGDEGSIYAARQGMRACNNNNMRNPIYISAGDPPAGDHPIYISAGDLNVMICSYKMLNVMICSGEGSSIVETFLTADDAGKYPVSCGNTCGNCRGSKEIETNCRQLPR